MNKSVLIVAGEPSGDNVGGLLCSELRLLAPDLDLFGLGGDHMSMSGMDIRYHCSQLSFLGFWEVLKHLPFIREAERDVLEQVKKRRPSLAILIDYPGFNLRLAARLKKSGIPVMYYVSPQVWAWGKGRIRKIRKLVDKMVVVFQFEKEMYGREGMNVEWYGHPLLEIVKPRFTREDFLKKIDFQSEEKYIGLFPGSRKQEVERILPVMKRALDGLSEFGMTFRGIVGCAPGIDDDFYRRAGGPGLRYLRALTYDLMTHSEMNLVASGTATLECAILESPLFILYMTSAATFQIARKLVKLPYVGLVNVVAGEKIAPEFIQHDCRPDLISGEMRRFLSDPRLRNEMIRELSSVRGKLGEPGASRKVAESALEMIEDPAN